MYCCVTEADIRDWCIGHIAKLLDRSAADVDPAAKFTRLGLDSATMINLIMAAEEWLGVEVELEAVYEYRNINALSVYLGRLQKRQSGPDAGPSSHGTS